MKIIFSYFSAVLAILALLPLQSTAQTMDGDNQTILEIAQSNSDLTILTRAVQAAGLTEALSGDGDLTVFAPTDQAFYGLPEGVLSALTKAENRETLIDILKYHVVEGELAAADVTAGIEQASDGMLAAETMNGELTAMLADGGVALKDAAGRTIMVTQTDIMASNGVIHLIDGVLLPEGVDLSALTEGADAMGMNEADDDGVLEEAGDAVETAAEETYEAAKTAGSYVAEGAEEVGEEVAEVFNEDGEDDEEYTTQNERSVATTGSYGNTADKTIVEVAASNQDFSTLVKAVEAADLADALGSDSGFTVFAPTNSAFEKVPSDKLNSLLQPSNQQQLQGLLKYHVVASKISAEKLIAAIEKNNGYFRIQTIGGESLYATMQDGNVTLIDGNGEMITVTNPDIEASNGVIHAIDSVLMPKEEM